MKRLMFLLFGMCFFITVLFGYEVKIDKSLPLEKINQSFSKTFGDSKDDESKAIIEADNGYIITGYTESFGAGDRDVWVIKIDKNGNKIWDKTFGGSDWDEVKAIIKADNEYIIAGNTESFGEGKDDAWIIKIDKNGNKIWDKTFGGRDYDYANAIIKADNGYVIAGNTESFGEGGRDVWVIKIDKNGNKIWDKTFGDNKSNWANAIIEADNGYIIAGYTESFGAGDYDAWVIKIDKNGNKIWDKTFRSSKYDGADEIIKADNGYIITGTTNSFGAGAKDAWIIKIDKNGNKIWDKTFGGNEADEANEIIKADNGYIIAGYTESFGAGDYDAWVIKIDKNGNKIWDKTFGGSDWDEAKAIIKADNGYIIAGYTNSFGAGGRDAWIIKIKEITLNSIIKDYIKEKINSIPKPPKEKKIVKGEFETTKEFQERVKREKIRIKKELKEYPKKVAQTIKKAKKEAIKFALEKLWGKPIIENLRYDADNQYFIGKLRFENKNFQKKIAIKVPLKMARSFKRNFSSLKPRAVFEYNGKSVTLKKIIVPYYHKQYLAQFTNYNLSDTKVAVNLSTKFDAINTSFSTDIKVDKPEVSSLDVSKLRDFNELDRELAKIKPAKIDNRKWLFVIGIEQYRFTDNIKYARRTALMFKKVMQKSLGIDESHTFTMIDDKATSAIIKMKFQKMLRRVKKGDTVYFYYNGHGIPAANKNFEPYMLADDVAPDYVTYDNFFSLKNIYSKLSQSRAKKVIAFVDSCFSGVTDGKSILKGVAATKLKPKSVKFNKHKMVVLIAGKSYQYSNGYDKKGYRLFSYYVMKNILNGDRNIRKLYLDTKRMTYKTSLEEYGDLRVQEPTIEGNFKTGL
jgi:predicted secreted protein